MSFREIVRRSDFYRLGRIPRGKVRHSWQFTPRISLSPAQRRTISDYVRENLANDISVTELAAIVCMSPAHFSRQFREIFCMAPYQFVLQERITRAKDLLATTTMSTTQVGMALGFSSQGHFAKLFRQFTGVTPKQYRAKL